MVANNISTWRLGDRLSSNKLHGLVNECIRRRRLSYLIPKHFKILSQMDTAKIQRNRRRKDEKNPRWMTHPIMWAPSLFNDLVKTLDLGQGS
jgi:hypothetical protein